MSCFFDPISVASRVTASTSASASSRRRNCPSTRKHLPWLSGRPTGSAGFGGSRGSGPVVRAHVDHAELVREPDRLPDRATVQAAPLAMCDLTIWWKSMR